MCIVEHIQEHSNEPAKAGFFSIRDFKPCNNTKGMISYKSYYGRSSSYASNERVSMKKHATNVFEREEE